MILFINKTFHLHHIFHCILKHQKNKGNEVILDDGVIPTIGETVSTNKVQGLQISKTVAYR